jgi:hypothetical protein
MFKVRRCLLFRSKRLVLSIFYEEEHAVHVREQSLVGALLPVEQFNTIAYPRVGLRIPPHTHNDYWLN